MAALLVGLGWIGACQGFAPNEIGSGLGAGCSRDDECQASKCVDGVCAIPCDANKCPSGMVCAKALCLLPVRAGFIYPGEIAQEPFTESVETGRSTLPATVPYLTSSFVEDAWLESDIIDAASTFYAGGARVIVGASPNDGPALVSFADQHPEARIFALGSRVVRPNMTSFDARTYQGYYLAGIAAGRTSKTHRLGMIGSVYSPSVAASINAFVLGAQSVTEPGVLKVELLWVGDFHDRVGGATSLERTDTEALLARGADVIAHTLDNNIPVSTVAQEGALGTFAIGANVRTACQGQPEPTKCIGSVYYNWGPVLASLIDDYHRQDVPQTVLESIKGSALDSPIGFIVDEGLVGAPTLSQEVDDMRSKLASDNGVGRVFEGPIKSTGQCEAATGNEPCVAMGARLDDQGLSSMCWLVDGLVEWNGTADEPALMPEEQDCAPPKMN